MEQTFFFDGQQVEADDLNNISDTLGAQLKNRTIDFFSKGVVSGSSSSFVFNDINNTIQIYPFIAYTNTGERIDVYKTIRSLALKLSDPSERRLTNKGDLPDSDFGWELNTTYDIYVAYISKLARPRAHKTTGDFYPTRIVSGFEFYAIRPGIDDISSIEGNTPLVRLCRLIYDGTRVIITSDGYMDISTMDSAKIYTKSTSVSPTVYNPKTAIVSMEDHVMSIGSGVPSPTNPHGLTAADIGISTKDVSTHEAEMHTPGLIADRSQIYSAFYMLLNSINQEDVLDNIILYNLSGNEQLHFNGVWINSYAYAQTHLFVQFNEGTAPTFYPLPAGTYTFGIDPSSRKVVCWSAAGAGHQIRLTVDSAGLNEVDVLTIMDEEEYGTDRYYNLASFVFSQTKQTSYIISSFATQNGISNFIEKEDLRVFGSMSPKEFQTTKAVVLGNWKDVLTIPYEVQVSSISIIGGNRLTGETAMPYGYISGFQIAYNTNRSITIYPGRCRDLSGTADIVLSNGLTKYVDQQWTSGGYGAPVGGLQNDYSTSCSLTAYGIPLHVFAIQNINGLADVAFDTDINGVHLNTDPTCPTYSYSYIRRIGTIYISHRAQAINPENREIVRPFTSFAEGNMLYIQYNTAPELIYVPSANAADDAEHLNMYDPTTQTFFRTYVPNGFNYRGRFSFTMDTTDIAVKVDNPDYIEGGTEPQYITYNMHQANNGSIFVPTATGTLQYLYGAGSFDIYMPNGTFQTNGVWDFTNHIYCMGYFDSRDI